MKYIIAVVISVLVLSVIVVSTSTGESQVPENDGVVLVSKNVHHPHPQGTHTPTPSPQPTNTPVPTAMPTHTPVQVGSGTLTREQVRHLLVWAGFPEWTHARLLRIAKCESGYNTNALNPVSQTRGLFQIHPVHRNSHHGDLYSGAFDPYNNVRAAYLLWVDRGFDPWVCK